MISFFFCSRGGNWNSAKEKIPFSAIERSEDCFLRQRKVPPMDSIGGGKSGQIAIIIFNVSSLQNMTIYVQRERKMKEVTQFSLGLHFPPLVSSPSFLFHRKLSLVRAKEEEEEEPIANFFPLFPFSKGSLRLLFGVRGPNGQ